MSTEKILISRSDLFRRVSSHGFAQHIESIIKPNDPTTGHPVNATALVSRDENDAGGKKRYFPDEEGSGLLRATFRDLVMYLLDDDE